jgi:glycosyltransferase involved in cell wall biosynthesis
MARLGGKCYMTVRGDPNVKKTFGDLDEIRKRLLARRDEKREKASRPPEVPPFYTNPPKVEETHPPKTMRSVQPPEIIPPKNTPRRDRPRYKPPQKTTDNVSKVTNHQARVDELRRRHPRPEKIRQPIPPAPRYDNYSRDHGPLVSVIIPCFNHGQYLDECVDSVLHQSYSPVEIIIVDDCSTDGVTPTIVNNQKKKSDKITVIFNETNKKLPASRNVAIRQASGKYILPLDADDKIHKECLAYYVDAAERKLGDIVCGGTEMFGAMTGSGKPRPYNFEQLKKENLMQCTALFQKAHWEEVGGYNETMNMGYEDWEFFLNMGKHGHFGYGVKHILFYYRKKKDSMVIEAAKHRDEIIQHIHELHPDLYPNSQRATSSPKSISEDAPRVSVIIPCYNAAPFLKDSLESVLKQTYQNFEIILIDDKSTDDTVACMETFANEDRRITLLFNSENIGPAGTRNYGIRKARGKYIVPLDADDMMVPTMLEKYVAVLDSGKADLVGSWYQKFGVHNGLVKTSYSFPRIANGNMLSCCTAFHKTHWNEVGGYNELVNGYEDWEMWINMGEHGHHTFVIQEPLLNYRTSRGTTMYTLAKKKDAYLKQTIKELHPKLYSPQGSSPVVDNISKPIETVTEVQKMKIRVIAICYNEEKMLPFFLRYYTSFCDEVVIYDNCSTDRSIEIIKSFPKTSIISYDTNGQLSDKKYLEIKNNTWKAEKNKYDWQIVVDTDEFVWHPNLLQILERYRNSGISLPKTNGFNMIHDCFPEDDGRQIMEIIKMGVGKPNYCKPAIFCPKMIKEMNYKPGAHKCDPRGVVRYSPLAEIFFLHYKYFGIDYFRERAKLYAPRLKGVDYDWGQMEYKKQVDSSIELYEKWAEPKKAKAVF